MIFFNISDAFKNETSDYLYEQIIKSFTQPI